MLASPAKPLGRAAGEGGLVIPDYQTCMRPLLQFGADGQEKNIKDAIAALASSFKLSAAELDELLPSGNRWRRTYSPDDEVWRRRENRAND